MFANAEVLVHFFVCMYCHLKLAGDCQLVSPTRYLSYVFVEARATFLWKHKLCHFSEVQGTVRHNLTFIFLAI